MIRLNIYVRLSPHSHQELNNGRIAMFAIIGQIVAELQTGKGPVEQFTG